MPPASYLLLLAASFAAGAVNAVAGGGTLLTFPALLSAGVLQKIANATSTVALLPGQASGLWGLRRDVQAALRGRPFAVAQLLLIGIVGGATGTYLFLHTPETLFRRVIPFLVLASVAVFAAQEHLTGSKTVEGESKPSADEDTLRLNVPVALSLLIIAVYGGFFGAGIGILTLAALGAVECAIFTGVTVSRRSLRLASTVWRWSAFF